VGGFQSLVGETVGDIESIMLHFKWRRVDLYYYWKNYLQLNSSFSMWE